MRATQDSTGPSTYAIFIWHGFFLALTKAMLDLNTIFPALVSSLVESKTAFGALYAIMLGVPFIFNVFFGHYLHGRSRKKPFLLLGIYLRAISYLGMAVFTLLFAETAPTLVLLSLFGWVFLFAFSGGFAGVSYADIIGSLVPKGKRSRLYAAKQFAGGVAMLLGGVVVVRVLTLESLGYPANYAVILGIGFVGLLVASGAFWFIREPVVDRRPEGAGSFRRFLATVPSIIRDDPTFLRFIVVQNLAGFSLMVLPFYMIFAQESFAIGQGYVGRYLLFQIAGAILSNLFWAWLARRRGSAGVVRGCVLVGGLIPLVAMAASTVGPDAYAVVFVLVGVVMSGRQVGFEPFLLDLAPEDQRTMYVGINGTLNFTKVLLPVLGGALMDLLGFRVTFGIVVLAMLAAVGLLRDADDEPTVPVSG